MFENKILKRILVPKAGKGIGEWRRLYHDVP
jgi:hypothetical protein